MPPTYWLSVVSNKKAFHTIGSEEGHILQYVQQCYHLHTLSLPAAICSRMPLRMLIIITLYWFIVDEIHVSPMRSLLICGCKVNYY